jgi:hypothetical protein
MAPNPLEMSNPRSGIPAAVLTAFERPVRGTVDRPSSSPGSGPSRAFLAQRSQTTPRPRKEARDRGPGAGTQSPDSVESPLRAQVEGPSTDFPLTEDQARPRRLFWCRGLRRFRNPLKGPGPRTRSRDPVKRPLRGPFGGPSTDLPEAPGPSRGLVVTSSPTIQEARKEAKIEDSVERRSLQTLSRGL